MGVARGRALLLGAAGQTAPRTPILLRKKSPADGEGFVFEPRPICVSHCLAATEHLNPDLLDVSRCLAATKHLLVLIIAEVVNDIQAVQRLAQL